MSTLQKYRLITKKKEQAEPNEIRMTARGFNSSYISYAMKIFDQKKFDHVVLKASGSAISKCCIVAEVLRHRIQGLALVSKIKNTQIHDEYEPKEEGLDDVTVTRNIAVLEILLTTDSNEDKNQVGYQAPLTEEEVKQSIKERDEKREHDRKTGGDYEVRGERREGGRGFRGGRRGFRGERRGGRGRGRGGERNRSSDRYGDREENREYGGYRGSRGYDRRGEGRGEGRRGGRGYGGRGVNYSHSQDRQQREERSPGFRGERGSRRGTRRGRGNYRGD